MKGVTKELIAFSLHNDAEGYYHAGQLFKGEQAEKFIEEWNSTHQYNGVLKEFESTTEFDDWLIGFGPKETFHTTNWLYNQYQRSRNRVRHKEYYRRVTSKSLL